MAHKKKRSPIKDYLIDNAISVKEAAAALKMNTQQLYRIISGVCRPRRATAQKLFEFMKGTVSMEEIRQFFEKPRCPYCERVLTEKILKMVEDKKEKLNSE